MGFILVALGVLAYAAIAYGLGWLRQDFSPYSEMGGALIALETIVLAIVAIVLAVNPPTLSVVLTAIAAALYFPGRLVYLFEALRREIQRDRRSRESEAARKNAEQDHINRLGVLIGLAEERFVGLAEYEVARRDRSVLSQLYRLSARATKGSNHRVHASSGKNGKRDKFPKTSIPLRAIADLVVLAPADVWVIVRRLEKSGLAKFVHARVDDRIPSWGGASITINGANEVLYVKPASWNEVVMGDKVTAIGAGATAINRSTVKDSLNRVESAYGNEVASAWKAIVDEVERSGDESSKELVNAVGEELQNEPPKRSILKSLFQGILAGAPAVNSLADSVLTFSKALGIAPDS